MNGGKRLQNEDREQDLLEKNERNETQELPRIVTVTLVAKERESVAVSLWVDHALEPPHVLM